MIVGDSTRLVLCFFWLGPLELTLPNLNVALPDASCIEASLQVAAQNAAISACPLNFKCVRFKTNGSKLLLGQVHQDFSHKKKWIHPFNSGIRVFVFSRVIFYFLPW